MIAVLLTTLFTASSLLAIATIAASWRRHGSAVLALRTELAACEEWREVRVQIREVTVRSSATVLRPDFAAGLTGRSSRPPALPAAA